MRSTSLIGSDSLCDGNVILSKFLSDKILNINDFLYDGNVIMTKLLQIIRFSLQFPHHLKLFSPML